MVTESFFSWTGLATFSGAVAAVVFIVQFLKLPLDKLKRIPTRAVVYLVSLAVLLLAQFFTEQGFSLEGVALAALNSVLVALSAMALYEQAVAEPEAIKMETAIDEMVAEAVPLEDMTQDD